jgi:transposase-like protein
VDDVLIFAIDGLNGFNQAIEAVYPKAEIQLCIVHQIQNSLKYVGSANRKQFAKELKKVYQAFTKEEAEIELNKLEEKWGKKYPIVFQSWKNKLDNLSVYFKYPKDIRKVIYTTNIIESVHRQFRTLTKTKGGFNSDDLLTRLVYLVYKDISKKWQKSISNWAEIISQFAIIFDERLEKYL